MSLEHIKDKEMADVSVDDATHKATEGAALDPPKEELDVGGRLLAEVALREDAAELMAPWTEKEEARLRRKADFVVVPLLTGALVLGAVDKVALGTAAVLNLRTDLNLVGQEFSWASSLIFFGSIASMFPALFVMQRFGSSLVFAGMVFLWGVTMLAMVGTKNFAGLAVCRFFLGLFEALTFPALNIIIASWYTRKEQVVRTAIIFSTMSSLINGLISYGASFVDNSHLSPWQVQFLIIGGITSLWGVLMALFLASSPVSAKFLTMREKVIAIRRLQLNQTGVAHKTFKTSQAMEALRDYKTWLLFLTNICLALPNSGINTFNSIIIQSLGFDVRQTLLMSMPVGMISWGAALLFSWVAVKWGQRCFTIILACVIPLLSTVLLHVIPRTNRGGSLGALFLIYFYWPPYLLMMTVAMANTAGYTKKMITYGIAYYGYLAGSIVGPQCFLASQAPTYTGGIVAMLICYCCAMVLVSIYLLNIVRLNRAKSKWLAEHPDFGTDSSELDQWRDETDFENRRMVYLR